MLKDLKAIRKLKDKDRNENEIYNQFQQKDTIETNQNLHNRNNDHTT